MALTLQESGDLMTDVQFRSRIKAAALHFANYVIGESPSTPAHNSRYKWAQVCFTQSDSQAQLIQPAVVMTDQVQGTGAAIIDADLQAAVESVIQTMI